MLSFPSAGLWCIMYKAAGVCFTLGLTLLSRFRHIAAFISTVEVNQGGDLYQNDLDTLQPLSPCTFFLSRSDFLCSAQILKSWGKKNGGNE